MANLHTNHHHVINISTLNPVRKTTAFQQWRRRNFNFKIGGVVGDRNGGADLVQQRPHCNDEDAGNMMVDERVVMMMDEYYVREHDWKVRRMVEDKSDEMREVAFIQAQAFHLSSPFFDHFFFQFFLAEVLSGLLYRLRNSPPDRYACLVAEPTKEDETSTKPHPQEDQRKLVGVVDVTVLRDSEVLRHLDGGEEYLYVSGIAVSDNYRRQKVATVLLKACEVISVIWGYEYLVLRAYEDDKGTRALYTNAGYRLVSRDPPWLTWIGRKRRILMIKRLSLIR